MGSTATTALRRTGWIAAEHFFWHHTQSWAGLHEPSLIIQPGTHFENAETKRRFKNLVEAIGFNEKLHSLAFDPATDDSLLSVHTRAHIDNMHKICAQGGGLAGDSTVVGRSSEEIARLAAGAVLSATNAILDRHIDNAYILCRPPGHHAEKDRAMGFCLYANAALGVKQAQKRGMKKVATVDWDVHHGNGTESIFYDDPNVLSISLHQDNLYPPSSGAVADRGKGDGEGSNINIPLPPGSGSGAYRHAFEQIVLPALRAFEPDMLFLPCGFDACALDPLGVMMLSSKDYAWMTRQIIEIADKYCAGRVLVTHEGGYSEFYVPFCGLAVLEVLTGADSGVEDPFADHIANYGGQDLKEQEREAVAAALH